MSLNNTKEMLIHQHERGTLPPTACAAEVLWDVQLSGTRLPTWAL
jgi:hypothetical protein